MWTNEAKPSPYTGTFFFLFFSNSYCMMEENIWYTPVYLRINPAISLKMFLRSLIDGQYIFFFLTFAYWASFGVQIFYLVEFGTHHAPYFLYEAILRLCIICARCVHVQTRKRYYDYQVEFCGFRCLTHTLIKLHESTVHMRRCTDETFEQDARNVNARNPFMWLEHDFCEDFNLRLQ